MPRVSICVPTFNGATYLAACLDSIMAQTFTDWELVIVDDCSADSTLEIAAGYARNDRRIRIERNATNLGLVENWNRCVDTSRGQWVKFVFQDDLLAPACVAELVSVAAHGHSLVFCEREFLFDEHTDGQTREHYQSIPTLSDIFGARQEVDCRAVATAILAEPRNFFGEPTAAMMARSSFLRFGYFNPKLVQFADLEFWMRVATNAGMAFVPSRLASFRFHSDSTSALNRSGREFRSGILDRLIILHEFAYNPHFATLRAVAAAENPPRSFRRELARKAMWLKLGAERSARAAQSPDPAPLDAWREVANDYPMLERSYAQLPLKIRRTLGRHLLWRFRRNSRSDS